MRLCLLLVLALLALPAAATTTDGGKDPVSFGRRDVIAVDRLATWSSPAVDLEALRREDAVNAGRTDLPLRIGYPMKTELTTENSGTWETLASGDRIWRLLVHSSGARWIVLGFDQFRLQDGGQLWAYDPAAKSVYGPRSVSDERDHGELWFPVIAGDSVVVELFWPARLASETPKLHLGTVSHGYKPFGSIGREYGPEDIGDSGSCNIDIMCPLGANWQDEKRGAVILLSGGSGFCSGSLINTTADDCRPYVLTAGHCSAGASTVFGFNFERPACNSGTPGPPSTYQVAGATVLANYAGTGSSDATLLQMSAAPPESFNVYYNGWNRGAAPPTQSIVIHHPSGDVKKIAFDDDPAFDGSNWGPNHWRIAEYEQGTTEPGSSGSPLFDQNSRIIGQLHGGTASCTSITYDEYGKVFNSWTGGGSNATRLSNWLDPEGTGAITMDGVDWSICAFNPVGEVNLNRTVYACNDTLSIQVDDDNLPPSPNPTVTVSSATEPAGETVTLTETPPGSQRFVGTFPITSTAASTGDGQLSVSAGDTITVTYSDADDGAGGSGDRIDTAAVDCTAPGLSNVHAINVTGNTADILWDSTEGSNSVVHYGTTPPGGQTTTNSSFVTSHNVRLTGLLSCQLYYYWVESSDSAGNTASADNAGSYYTFSTGQNVTPTYNSSEPPVPAPPTGTASPTPAVVQINVPDTKTVLDVNVRFNMTHSYDGDSIVTLRHPDGTAVILSNRRGSGGDNYVNTVFDDEASTPIGAGSAPFTGSFIPDSALSALDGKDSQGVWKLEVLDNVSGDSGTITGFDLILTYPAQSCGPDCEQASAALVSDSCGSGGAGSANGYWDDGEQAVFKVALHNNGTLDLTGVSATLTPITPGVTLVDATATYPTIVRDTTVDSDAPHFTAQLDEGFACGAPIEFQVTITTNEGTFNDTFQAGTAGHNVPGGNATALDENFASGIPATWSIVDGGSGGGAAATWNTANPGARAASAPISTPFAIIDSDNAGQGGVTQDEQLITPVLNLSSATAVTLEFDQYFRWYNLGGSEKGDVDVRSSLTGGAWVNVLRNQNASSTDPDHKSLNITAQAAGAADVQIRFRYYDGAFDWYWMVDNVKVTYPSTPSCTIVNCDVAAPPPGEVLHLQFDTRTDASWSAVSGASSYNLYRGADIDLPKLYTGQVDSCLRMTTASVGGGGLTNTPALGAFDWYLVRAANGSGEGPAGSGTAAARTLNSSGVCP